MDCNTFSSEALPTDLKVTGRKCAHKFIYATTVNNNNYNNNTDIDDSNDNFYSIQPINIFFFK